MWSHARHIYFKIEVICARVCSLNVNHGKKNESSPNFIQKMYFFEIPRHLEITVLSTFLEERISENYLLEVFFSSPPTRISLNCISKFILIDHHNATLSSNLLLQTVDFKFPKAITQRAAVNETTCLYSCLPPILCLNVKM